MRLGGSVLIRMNSGHCGGSGGTLSLPYGPEGVMRINETVGGDIHLVCPDCFNSLDILELLC